MNALNVKTEVFEGPFDLLFHLIEKNKIDIYDIPIVSLTEQYMEYLSESRESQPLMENLSRFLLMAATLLEIKSRLLLPESYEDEKEEDPREALVAKLLEYKRFKIAAEELKAAEERGGQVFYRESGVNINSLKELARGNQKITGVTSDLLFSAFSEVMRRKEQKTDVERRGFSSVERDVYTIEEKIGYIRGLLALCPRVEFGEMFQADAHKIEVVVTFLAVLELIRLGELAAAQEGPFGKIIISWGSEKT